MVRDLIAASNGKKYPDDPGDGAKAESKCICQRPKGKILCGNCGNIMKGRIRKVCPTHRMVTFLCDISACNKCGAMNIMLLEVDET